MPIKIIPYSDNHIALVKDFNIRLKAKGINFQFPESNQSPLLPHYKERAIYQDYYLAIENDSIVRGGYILKQQNFILNNNITAIGNYQLPLSEGTIDKKYNMLGIQMLSDVMKKQSLLYSLGMGGLDKQLPQLLSAMGWRVQKVPFYFKACHPRIFLKEMPFLHRQPLPGSLCNIAAATGLGAAGIKLWQWSLTKRHTSITDYKIETAPLFDERTDKLCTDCSKEYSLLAQRSQEVLNILYPPEDKRFYRLIISDANNSLSGWAVLLDTKMEDNKYFGNLRVGTIADCLAKPEQAKIVIAAAVNFLVKRNVDIIISNQSHSWWCAALSDSGFLKGPSNFILALSKGLTLKISETDPNFRKIHFNRGDGDGPIHL